MKKFLIILGSLIFISGFLTVFFTIREHTKYKSEMTNLLEDRVIITQSTTSQASQDQESTLVDFTIEGLGEDQKVNITEGTPVISIPSLGILAPIIDGTDDYSLKLGVGKFKNSVKMGEFGNFSLAGHSSTIYNQVFNGLENIKLLDKIECYDETGKVFNYYVVDKFKTDAYNVGVTHQTQDTRLTLVTCTEGGVRRFIVVALLMSDDELYEYKANLKREQVLTAINISDNCLDMDIASYFNNKNHSSKVYRVIDFKYKEHFTINNFIFGGDRVDIRKVQRSSIN